MGMIELPDDFHLALEASDGRWIRPAAFGQQLQGDGSFQLGMHGRKDGSHPADSELALDAVRAKVFDVVNRRVRCQRSSPRIGDTGSKPFDRDVAGTFRLQRIGNGRGTKLLDERIALFAQHYDRRLALAALLHMFGHGIQNRRLKAAMNEIF
jgi:hypothetical protein